LLVLAGVFLMTIEKNRNYEMRKKKMDQWKRIRRGIVEDVHELPPKMKPAKYQKVNTEIKPPLGNVGSEL